MKKIIDNPTLFKNTEFNLRSCYLLEGKKIFYHEIFKNMPKGLEGAVKRVVPKINLDNIKSIVNTTETMSDIRKEYLNMSLSMRYEQIILPSYLRLMSKNKTNNNIKD